MFTSGKRPHYRCMDDASLSSFFLRKASEILPPSWMLVNISCRKREPSVGRGRRSKSLLLADSHDGGGGSIGVVYIVATSEW